MDLIQFARNHKGEPIGCFVAVDRDNVGWSLCNKKDKWNRKLAIQIARERAIFGTNKPVPKSIYSQWLKMLDRVERYYKDENN